MTLSQKYESILRAYLADETRHVAGLASLLSELQEEHSQLLHLLARGASLVRAKVDGANYTSALSTAKQWLADVDDILSREEPTE